jgi:thioredoxin reductase (NADPH)
MDAQSDIIAPRPKEGEPYDVIIIGSGPSGLTSAIYTTRAALSTLVIGGYKWGGQLMLTTEVDNFPGFPKGIQGPELMQNMRDQAERFGAAIVDVDVEEVNFSEKPFTLKAGGKDYIGKSVIIATGADTLWLGIESEAQFIGRGISSCAPCDAPFFREKNVIVVGGGDSAMEEALVLTRYAREVTIIHRRDSFRASEIMQQKVKANPKIKIIWNSTIEEIKGTDKVEGVVLNNVVSNEKTEMPIDGIFVAIGHVPMTNILRDKIELDEKGYVKQAEHSTTSVEGVFVAGDVHDHHYRQAITAAGLGCMAAMDCEKWLENQS